MNSDMNAPIALQVKCYLLPGSARVNAANIAHATEIRRFVLTHSWFGLYAELLSKVTSSFAGLLKTDAVLATYWQDEEAELVGFASDEDMRYANDLLVAFARSKSTNAPHIFKVYVANVQEQPQAIHHGVVCDGCGTAGIAGARFKCTVCPDYDLCGKCEASGVHKETAHAMRKIERCPFGFGGLPRGGCTRERRHGPRHGHQQGPVDGSFFSQLGQFMPVLQNPEELKAFGQHFKSFMEPFGVDVDYFVDGKAKPKETPAAAETKMDQSEATSAKPAEKEEVKPEASSATAPPQATSMDTAFVQAMNLMKGFGMGDLMTHSQNVEESFVNVEVDAEKERELKVVKALDALKLMGYTDDGGWLTRLAIAKDGNINAVLDAIAPK